MARRPLVLALALTLASSLGAVPTTLNYQGRLRTAAGANLPDSTGNTLVFRLYTTATGGGAFWTETWNSATSCVTTTAGLFNVMLGSFQSLGAVPFDQQYWLDVQVNGDAAPMAPRT